VGETVRALFLLLLPYVRPARGGPDEGGGQDAPDPAARVTSVLLQLAPLLESGAALALLPYFAALLAPGARALTGAPRSGVIALLGALAAATPAAALLRAPFATLAALAATSPKRLGEPDYDAVMAGLESLRAPEGARALLFSSGAGARAGAAAILHQAVHLLLDGDASLRAGALGTLTAVARAAAGAVEGAGGAGAEGAAPALDAVAAALLPALRAVMATASPTLRRGPLLLLADVVWAFRGLVGDAAAREALHLDLLPLVNKAEPEADVFLNLTHVQIHRRARALGRLTALLSGGACFADATLRHFVLPACLHALHDEAGGGGGGGGGGGAGAVTVQVRGRTATVGGDAAGTSGGLHSEAVKLLGAVAGALPWAQYAPTLRLLLTQVARAPPGPLEKVLVRAAAAMAAAWHFDVAPVAGAGAAFETEEAALGRLLSSAISAKGSLGALSKAALLALKKQPRAAGAGGGAAEGGGRPPPWTRR
jgi:U3 small nucleolar RNA-associated protein 20